MNAHDDPMLGHVTDTDFFIFLGILSDGLACVERYIADRGAEALIKGLAIRLEKASPGALSATEWVACNGMSFYDAARHFSIPLCASFWSLAVNYSGLVEAALPKRYRVIAETDDRRIVDRMEDYMRQAVIRRFNGRVPPLPQTDADLFMLNGDDALSRQHAEACPLCRAVYRRALPAAKAQWHLRLHP